MTVITKNTLCFTNNIRQLDGGTHLAGFKAALTRTINNYAADNKLFRKEKIVLSGDDVRKAQLQCFRLKFLIQNFFTN